MNIERKLSYKQVAELIFDDPDVVTALAAVADEHKNWGQFQTRTPSYVIVALLDAYKALAEQQLGDKVPLEIDAEDFDDSLAD